MTVPPTRRLVTIPLSTDEILARRRLGEAPDQRWVDWAVERMVAGDDTPRLRWLAGEEPPFDRLELESLADRTFEELGLTLPSSESEAFHTVVVCNARRVVAGASSWRAVATSIYEWVWDRDPSELPGLRDFRELLWGVGDQQTFDSPDGWRSVDDHPSLRAQVDDFARRTFAYWLEDPHRHAGWYSAWEAAHLPVSLGGTVQADASAAPQCSNCGATLTEGDRFCRHCGQATTALELTPARFIGSLVETYLSSDATLPRTILGLARSPGRVASQWLAGQRRRFASPLALVVTVGVFAGLVQGPLTELRAEHIPTGSAVYGVSLLTRPLSLLVVCAGLAVPVGWLTSRMLTGTGVRRTWLEWTVVALYGYALAVAAQVLLLALGAAFEAVARSPVALWVEALLPVVGCAWTAAGSVPRRQLAALGAVVVAHVVVVGAVSLGAGLLAVLV